MIPCIECPNCGELIEYDEFEGYCENCGVVLEEAA